MVPQVAPAKEFFTDNLLVRNHFIIVMIGWTGLAPWEFEFPFPGLNSLFQVMRQANVVPGRWAWENVRPHPCHWPSEAAQIDDRESSLLTTYWSESTLSS